ncbi:MAG: 3-deoxy-8-phosphooctulonate synthase [Deltaproteobacteria bacterium]|nr:3-deoxy-8-phosphooctulonate synthase [Deltaproteobacteria bacterium]MBW1736792.1 3-deoxy-8-phosphooctulonate synthase [Deltaproteobacteria bacterium]MBW1909511.1 3-deoxy-8-phosphooctulonate synthase [Deltaproteobacteria bacterium]MBW2032066.1 3-deoxy-8-phosphooctulonate synthase [Deltaproteobacteria bacterium]MBW2114756.1 3-deoxy-8-phosphooctulonate synthase [Deltaproteobacteria bacterium]
MENVIKIGDLVIDTKGPFFLISGPCVIEDETKTLETAHFLRQTAEELGIPVIFKTSYDKANRTSLVSYRGPGIKKGLEIIRKVKEETGLPVLSDVHNTDEIEEVIGILDMIQIPAFLCRQTDLLIAAAQTGIPINIKKGQFLSPYEMGPAIEKVTSTGNHSVMVTERGSSFGYNNLVVDIRSIAIMKKFGFPVVFDATHSVQLPGGEGTCSGGQREFVSHLSRAAVAAGADGVFIEIHADPDSALCDGPNSLPFDEVRPLLRMLKEIHSLIRF